MDWGIKVLAGKWSEEKMKKAIRILSDLIEQYEPSILAIKKLHPARSTEKLSTLANKIKGFAQRKGIKVFQYSIKEIEKFFIESEKLSKKNLIEAMVKRYPELHPDVKREKSNRNPYKFRIFEAVALAICCYFNKA